MKKFKEVKKLHKRNGKVLEKKSMKLMETIERIKSLNDEQLTKLLDLIYGREIKILERDEIFIKGIEEGIKLKKVTKTA